MTHTITMIGAGNMARALLGGLREQGQPAKCLCAADPDPTTRSQIERDFNIRTFADNAQAVAAADLIILCVKPQVIDAAAREIATACRPGAVIASVAAGVPLARLARHFDTGRAIVRVMPNTPALYGHGATGMHASSTCSAEQVRQVRSAFEAVGRVFEIDDEQLMDVVTAVSGSGPAYFFALAEALAMAGEAAGLDRATADELAAQTAAGAGVMLRRDAGKAADLRQRVTSPGGTTAAALEVLEQQGFQTIINNAVRAAIRRGRELGET